MDGDFRTSFVREPNSLRHNPALVLNADYRPLSYYPLSLWPWQEAVKAAWLDRVTILAEYDDVDTAVVVLGYADGRLATIRNSRRAPYGYDQRVEVLGAGGTLAAENEIENTVVKSTTAGVTSAKPVYFFLERYMRAYAIEWSAFVDACVDGAPVPATIQDGVNALALAEAAAQSLAEGRPVAVTPAMTGG